MTLFPTNRHKWKITNLHKWFNAALPENLKTSKPYNFKTWKPYNFKTWKPENYPIIIYQFEISLDYLYASTQKVLILLYGETDDKVDYYTDTGIYVFT